MSEGSPLKARSATVSTNEPFSRKGPQTSRERFPSMDLETLYNEFKEVAAHQDQHAEEEDASAPPVEGELESDWLDNAGLHSLTAKVKKGKPITAQDISEETKGFTPAQVQAIKSRVETLNGTLRSKNKNKKNDARDLFKDGEGSGDGASEAAGAEANQQNNLVVEDFKSRPSSQFEPSTNFFDLSEGDQKQVQCLNLIQLTSVMETTAKNVIARPSRNKKKKKSKEKFGIFGSRISELVEKDRKHFKNKMPCEDVPVIFSKMIAYLKEHGLQEEGIFRKAGGQSRIKSLRQTIEDKKGDIDFDKLECRSHDVAALLKQFLRETREPIFTDEYIETFASTQQLGPELQLYSLQLLVMLLPSTNRIMLRQLFQFLVTVAQHSEVNKMGMSNLAVVFAPTLFYVRGTKGQKMLKEVEMQVSTAATLKLMLENADTLWHVPSDIMAQIRFVNDQRAFGRKASKPKEVKRILSDRKKAKAGEAGEALVEWVEGSTEQPAVKALVAVTVKAGDVREGVKITERSTAQGVLKELQVDDSVFCLSEVGGNIGCRRLDDRSLILPILKVNPRLTLVVVARSEFSSFA